MNAETAAIRCEMFCTEPIGPDGEPGGDAWKACCPICTKELKFLCREVLPAIRRYGYYSPPGSSVDDEFADFNRQAGFRDSAASLLDDLLGGGAAAALGWGNTTGGAP